MTPAISLEELLAWNDESAAFWNRHLGANPSLLELPCSIGGAATVQEFVRHIWGVELIWAQRVAGLPRTSWSDMPSDPLVALFGLHVLAVQIWRGLFDDPGWDWNQSLILNYDWLPPHARTSSHRKLAAHTLFHSQRHWAQLATLVRTAGSAADFPGDLIFSPALR
jgi:uncharacterized damage-inducible protein DinB